MKPANPLAEDMFEKAREAFFGSPNATPTPSVSSAKPQSKLSVKDTSRQSGRS